MGKPEGEIEDYLGKLCKYNDILYYKFTAPSTLGVPDRILLGNNKTAFVELKRPGGKPRPSQLAIFKRMQRHSGQPVYVVSTKAEARQIIAKIIDKPPILTKSQCKTAHLTVIGQFKVDSIT